MAAVGKRSKVTVTEKQGKGDGPPRGAAFYQLCAWDAVTSRDFVSCGSVFYSYRSESSGFSVTARGTN